MLTTQRMRHGGINETRTRGLLIPNQALCHLSYNSVLLNYRMDQRTIYHETIKRGTLSAMAVVVETSRRMPIWRRAAGLNHR